MGFDFELARKVEELAEAVPDSNVHWICTPNGECETRNGSDWCFDCGRFMFKHLRRKDRKHFDDYYFDGGCRYESDSHRFCAHCGKWLRVSLTDHGVQAELEHYRENGVSSSNLANDAYAIDLLMNVASWGSDDEEEIQALARDLISKSEARASLRKGDSG